MSSRRTDTNTKSPAASQFQSPLSTIVASPSPDKNVLDEDNIDAAQVKVCGTVSVIIMMIIISLFSSLTRGAGSN